MGRERWAMSEGSSIIRPLNSKRSSYCMLFPSRKYTQSYDSTVGIVADDISPIRSTMKTSTTPAMVCELAGLLPFIVQVRPLDASPGDAKHPTAGKVPNPSAVSVRQESTAGSHTRAHHDSPR